jgi:hypothetical protein
MENPSTNSNERQESEQRTATVPEQAQGNPTTLQAGWHDITVIYGPNSEHRLLAHRLNLCNASQWFKRELRDAKESNCREITLHGDHVVGVEALLEFCYRHDYSFKELSATLDSKRKEQAKILLTLHLRAFATAAKYGADDLGEIAFTRLRELLEYCTEAFLRTSSWGERYSFVKPIRDSARESYGWCLQSLLQFMVEQLYESPGHLPAFVYFSGIDSPKNAEFFDTDSPKDNTSQPSTPLDRARKLLIMTVMHIWDVDSFLRVAADSCREHLRSLTKKVPNFGADLAFTALEYNIAYKNDTCKDATCQQCPPPYKEYLQQLGKLEE